MVIILTGGGSGGHITPLLATASKLKQLVPEARLVYVGQKGDRFGRLAEQSDSIDAVEYIRAGKFRRYHKAGWRQLLDFKTLALNAKDFFKVLLGLIQSWFLLKKLSPSAVFIKGGFIGVPVGLAAAIRKVPFVTHDSDAIPGLANRVIGKWASYHAVALPASEYKNYPVNTTVEVGIPLASEFRDVSNNQKTNAKKNVGLQDYEQIILVTGGGLGAKRMNEMVVESLPGLLAEYPKLAVIHLAGETQEKSVANAYKNCLKKTDLERVRVIGFTNELAKISASADVIITRAGATTLAEFATQKKACIVVPNISLTGGHQLKNAELLRSNDAVLMVTEGKGSTNELVDTVEGLLDNPKVRVKLASNLAKFAHPEAAAELARLIVKAAGQDENSTKKGSNNNNDEKI